MHREPTQMAAGDDLIVDWRCSLITPALDGTRGADC